MMVAPLVFARLVIGHMTVSPRIYMIVPNWCRNSVTNDVYLLKNGFKSFRV